MFRFITIIIVAIATFFRYGDFSGNADLSRLPNLVPDMQTLELEPVQVSTDYFGYPHSPSIESTLGIIANNEYGTIDSLLHFYDSLSRVDYRYEYFVGDMLYSLTKADNPLSFLKGWKNALPNSPFVELAYAKFYYRRGWAVRGNGFINTVKNDDLTTFTDYMKMTNEKLNEVEKIDPKILGLWTLRVDLARTMGEDEFCLYSINESLKINPYQYYIRKSYQNSLMRRWGGSKALMEAYADRCDSLAKYNPRLVAIRSSIFDEQGREYNEKKNQKKSIASYAKALAYNPMDIDMNWWCCDYYYSKKKYKQALKYTTNIVTYFSDEEAKPYYITHAQMLYAEAKMRSEDYSKEEYIATLMEIQKYLTVGLQENPDDNDWAKKIKSWTDGRLIELTR